MKRILLLVLVVLFIVLCSSFVTRSFVKTASTDDAIRPAESSAEMNTPSSDVAVSPTPAVTPSPTPAPPASPLPEVVVTEEFEIQLEENQDVGGF